MHEKIGAGVQKNGSWLFLYLAVAEDCLLTRLLESNTIIKVCRELSGDLCKFGAAFLQMDLEI